MRIGLGARRVWWAWSAGLVVLGFIEALVLHLIGNALLPGPVAVALDVVVGAATLALLVVFVSPLWSAHTVSDEGVAHLRLGLLGSVVVRPGDVAQAGSHTPTAIKPAEPGVGFDDETGRLSLVRSPTSPLVLLTFTRPVPARMQVFRRVLATECLAGTDDPQRLLEALAES
ncbi:hypothetical protein [Promicromonospora sp. NPDC060271]|uniref:hypothetical protein n=1 Tax=Promicromonospora sp. NPDC060271 TaxID=3347089 RepID=UPI0036562C23